MRKFVMRWMHWPKLIGMPVVEAGPAARIPIALKEYIGPTAPICGTVDV
jgi:hypothetical protein